jgi:hypothetical protein
MKPAKKTTEKKAIPRDGWVDPLRVDAHAVRLGVLERRWRRFEVFDSRQRLIKFLLFIIVALQLIIIFKP